MKRSIDSLVADIADGKSVDWRALEDGSSSDQLLRGFKVIASIGEGRGSAAAERPPVGYQLVRGTVIAATSLAVMKTAVALVAASLAVPFRFGPRAVLASVFAVLGITLVTGGRRDPRSQTLGALFLLIGPTVMQAYLLRAQAGPVGVPASWFASVSPEAFLALALWAFVWVFPRVPEPGRTRQIGAFCVWVSASIAAVLFVGSALAASDALKGSVLFDVVSVFDRESPQLLFWPLLVGSGALALPYLLAKTVSQTVEDRARATLLGGAVVLSLGPFAVAVLAAPFVPLLRSPEVQALVGPLLYGALALLVPATIYSVAVRRVPAVHLVIRRATQHALAKNGVLLAIGGAVAYTVAGFYVGRSRPLGELLTQNAGLLVVTVLGLVTLTFRAQLLAAVDRWFARGPMDYPEVMTRLASRLAGRRNIRDIHEALEGELVQSLNASGAKVSVLNHLRTEFVRLDGTMPGLPVGAALVGLVGASRDGLPAGALSDDIERLLPSQDREWLARTGAAWLFPLFDSAERILGFVCLGESNGVPYSHRDRVLVSAMADQVALRMENLSLRHGDPTEPVVRAGSEVARVDWQNERAMQCRACQQVSPAAGAGCLCGDTLEPAALPLVLNQKFQVECVLGAGGMSVVYRALDVALNRRVALKAMPTVTPRHAERLRREARAMASVLHPNLAMIYGAEMWRDVPVLVMEHLEAGTLLDALRAGALEVDDALDVGILLADALDRMHGAGLLHRDIKPSNIGFSADGTPKLLDFGLAAMLDRVHDESGRPTPLPRDAAELSTLLDGWSATVTQTLTQQLVGTPLYLSPEALDGQEPAASFDLWSLGVVLYQAIAGRHPLAGYPTVEAMRRLRSVRLPDIRDFRPDCPPLVAAFLNDALSLAEERRPASAAAFRAALQSLRLASAVPSLAGPHPSLY